VGNSLRSDLCSKLGSDELSPNGFGEGSAVDVPITQDAMKRINANEE
jgi:hypothetical protein